MPVRRSRRGHGKIAGERRAIHPGPVRMWVGSEPARITIIGRSDLGGMLCAVFAEQGLVRHGGRRGGAD